MLIRRFLVFALVFACSNGGGGGGNGHPSGSGDQDVQGADTATDTDAPGDTDAPWNPTWCGLGDGGGCDCGCGVPDPDCGGYGCTNPGCVNASCSICFDVDGGVLDCYATPDGPEGWTCAVAFYGDDSCDCGCGIDDPDCGGAGCAEPGCEVDACYFCWGGETPHRCDEFGDNPPPPVPDEWTCNDFWFGTVDGCDCGCGALDWDCRNGESCAEPGCDAPACKWCHSPDGIITLCDTN